MGSDESNVSFKDACSIATSSSSHGPASSGGRNRIEEVSSDGRSRIEEASDSQLGVTNGQQQSVSQGSDLRCEERLKIKIGEFWVKLING